MAPSSEDSLREVRRFSEQQFGQFSNVLDASSDVISGSLQHRFTSSICVSRCKVNQPFNGQATPDLAVVLISAGRCNFTNLGLGFGRSRHDSQLGDFVVIPPNAPSLAEGAGPFEQMTVAIPWTTVRRGIELGGRLSVQDL